VRAEGEAGRNPRPIHRRLGTVEPACESPLATDGPCRRRARHLLHVRPGPQQGARHLGRPWGCSSATSSFVGLGAALLCWAWTTRLLGEYMPVTRMTYEDEAHLWGSIRSAITCPASSSTWPPPWSCTRWPSGCWRRPARPRMSRICPGAAGGCRGGARLRRAPPPERADRLGERSGNDPRGPARAPVGVGARRRMAPVSARPTQRAVARRRGGAGNLAVLARSPSVALPGILVMLASVVALRGGCLLPPAVALAVPAGLDLPAPSGGRSPALRGAGAAEPARGGSSEGPGRGPRGRFW
jgi:hypothetical protein